VHKVDTADVNAGPLGAPAHGETRTAGDRRYVEGEPQPRALSPKVLDVGGHLRRAPHRVAGYSGLVTATEVDAEVIRQQGLGAL
jgi:hypothetical protein